MCRWGGLPRTWYINCPHICLTRYYPCFSLRPREINSKSNRSISQQPFSGTRMYMACYIPEPTMYGAYCQRGLCSPPWKLSPCTLWRTKRQYTLFMWHQSKYCSTRWNNKKLPCQKKEQTKPRNMTNKTHSQKYLNICRNGGTPRGMEVTDVSADWIDLSWQLGCCCCVLDSEVVATWVWALSAWGLVMYF